MNILCKIFNHHFNYYLTCNLPKHKNFRVCTRCGCMQEYRVYDEENLLGYNILKTGWYTLVQRTQKGAEKWLERLEKQQ